MIDLRFTPTRPPRAHQWEALEHARGREAFAYLMEMGTGKSKVGVDEAIQLFLTGVIDRWLITAGSGSYEDWISKHLPENVPATVRVLAHLWQGGHTVGERERLNRLASAPPDVFKVLVVNTESLGTAQHAETVCTNFVRGGRALMLVDESTMIKNDHAGRTVVATNVGALAVGRRIMTGSPITKNPLDLWGQLTFLGIEDQFASNFYSFRARFCTTVKIRAGVIPGKRDKKTGAPAVRRVTKVTGYQNMDRLSGLLRQHSFRVLKEDCLDLPPKIYEEYAVEMTAQQKRAYREMSRLATTEIEAGAWSTAKNAMGRLARLHQITLGHLMDEEGVLHALECNRPSAVCDLVEEAGDKVIIWCAYRKDVTLVLAALENRFPDRFGVRYDGTVPVPERAENKKLFQDGEASWFVGTAATGGIGVTLTSSANTIYYSNSFRLDHRLQSEDRNHRDGQIRPVTYVDMICRGTVEEHIINVLRSNKNVADALLGDGVRDWLEWIDPKRLI